MKVLVSGGASNGKTAFAEDLAVKLSKGRNRYYVATMIPYDAEDRQRIKNHIDEREGKGFITVETGRDIPRCLDGTDIDGAFLIDSVTALLTNEMFWGTEGPDLSAPERCVKGILQIVSSVSDAVFISDYIFSDAERYDDITEGFRKGLALIDRSLAEACDAVIELSCGNIIFHKGGPDLL